MKLKTTAMVLLLAASTATFGATYTINNGSTTTASGITNSSGQAFRNGTVVGDALGGTNAGTSGGPGVVALGVFSTEDFSTFTAISDFTNAFTQLGSTGTFASAGPTSLRGIFNFGLPQVTIAGNASFEAKNMFLLVGNGTSFANSTEVLVLKNSRTFLSADDAVVTGVTVSFTTANSTLLYGTSVADVRTTGSDSSVTAGWATLAPVPEPSVALLGALGALGLIRRRR